MDLNSKGLSTYIVAIAIVAVIAVAAAVVVFLPDDTGHNVTYNANGGAADTGYTDPWTVKETNFESLDALFVRAGDAIVEWNTAADGSGIAYHQGDKVPGECSVYAIWEAGYAVDYHGNGGKTSDGVTDYRLVEEHVSVSMLVNPGFLFTGWNTAADGSGEPYAPMQPVTESLGLYAQWVKSISDEGGKYTFDADAQLKVSAAAIKGPLGGTYEIKGNAFNASGDKMSGGSMAAQIVLYKCSSVTDAATGFQSMIDNLETQPAYTVTESSLAGADRCVDIDMNLGFYTVHCSAALVSNVWVTAMDYSMPSSLANVHSCLSDMISAFPA